MTGYDNDGQYIEHDGVNPDNATIRSLVEYFKANPTKNQQDWFMNLPDEAMKFLQERRLGFLRGETSDEAVVTPETAGCGTAFCLAGQALVDAGYTWTIVGWAHGDRWTRDDGSQVESVWSEARDLLRINEAQAQCLFAATNTIEMLDLVALAIEDGKSDQEVQALWEEADEKRRQAEYEAERKEAEEYRAANRARLAHA